MLSIELFHIVFLPQPDLIAEYFCLLKSFDTEKSTTDFHHKPTDELKRHAYTRTLQISNGIDNRHIVLCLQLAIQ